MSEAERAVGALLDLMARLRDPEHGCPWDRAQSFATIAPYTIEEAYEVADAIEHGDREHLREELGDLLFQVVFHARIAQERGWFDFTAVADGIREKLVRRHPHLFAGAAIAPEDLVRVWEEQKAQERAAATAPAPGGSTVLAGVPRALPALIRAAKLGRRA
ncbi:MAG: MazG family protein, partial [Sinobacteraceae bacterium]|nr:MazG family protein [Nevskiaceae bacterium]